PDPPRRPGATIPSRGASQPVGVPLREGRVPRTHLHTCTLSEAGCGIVVETEGGRVTAIRGDEQDGWSRGYVCPKAPALKELHEDPDRLRRPLLRDGTRHREIDWEEAFDRAAHGLARVRARHGRDAVAVYQGNPSGHNL